MQKQEEQLTLIPLSAAGGVKICDLDLNRADAWRDRLRSLFEEVGLLLFPRQSLSKRELVEAARLFGTPMHFPLANYVDPEVPEIVVVGTRGAAGDIEPDPEEHIGKIDWHTDLAYVETPNRGALLYAHIVPPKGGLTGFVDRIRTYADLDPRLAAGLEGMSIVQSWRYAVEQNGKYQPQQKNNPAELDKYPDLKCPLVFEHPLSGMKILNIAPQWNSTIIDQSGHDRPDLLEALIEHSLQDKFVYWHTYGQGDVIVWDNWRMIHAASGTQGKYDRMMYRATLSGTVALGAAMSG